MNKGDLYRKLVKYAYDGIYFVDKNRKIVLWNKAAEKITGFSEKEVVGSRCSDNILMHIDQQGVNLCLGACPLAKTIEDGDSREVQVFLHHKRGHRVPVNVRVARVENDDGEIIGAVEIFSDASNLVSIRERLEELECLAMLDPLTGLPNRRYMGHELEVRLDELKRYGWPFGVMFFDIDHFKQVNDQYGHEAGDMVLKMVARNFLHNIRSSDVIGRWGGDEFVGVLRNVDAVSLVTIGERYRMLIKNSVVHKGKDSLKITASVGVTMAREEDTALTVLDRADKKMYAGKKAGGDCVFDDEAT